MTLTAVLFAGGESRRMGVDKATLEVNGEPLWARQLRILKEINPEALWVSARTRPAWCHAEIEVVLDEPPSRGPLSGLCAALKKMRTTHLLALAVDLPRMEALHLKILRCLAQAGQGLVPMVGDRFEPLCAIYRATPDSVATAEETLLNGDCSMHRFISVLIARKGMTVFSVSESERKFYFNMNTPRDFATTRSADKPSVESVP